MGSSIRTAFAIFAFLFIIINASSVVALTSISSGQSLGPGQYLEQGPYRFIMQTDCNLVLYANLNKALWNSKTSGKGTNCSANLLITGDLVVLDGDGVKVFESGPKGAPSSSYFLVMQSDGNVVIYPPALWNTMTSQ